MNEVHYAHLRRWLKEIYKPDRELGHFVFVLEEHHICSLVQKSEDLSHESAGLHILQTHKSLIVSRMEDNGDSILLEGRAHPFQTSKETVCPLVLNFGRIFRPFLVYYGLYSTKMLKI